MSTLWTSMRGRGGWGMGYAERNFADQNFREKYLKKLEMRKRNFRLFINVSLLLLALSG